jgi:hypothetical protein
LVQRWCAGPRPALGSPACAPEPRARSELLRAIQGRGAFRRFKDLAGRLGLLEAWYEHQRKQLEVIAIDWCRENGISYTIRGDGPGLEKK